MEKEKKVAVKPPKKTSPRVAKPLVELVSYAIKMVIPTGQYANIQPEIIVKSGSIEDAHNYIAPHMNKLWKEYYLVNERRPEPPKAPTAQWVDVPGSTGNSGTASASPAQSTLSTVINTFGGKEIGGKVPVNTPSNIPGPESSVALIKATQAIESCMSLDALELIEQQVLKSVKLSHEDKESLMPLLNQKGIDLTFPDEDEK